MSSELQTLPIPELRAALLAWYDRSRRDLPWRTSPGSAPDPYRVWLSEVMLQQTRVETVRPYFERWMARFPDLDTLANAGVDDVLKAWEGLGYYSRARNLHRAVREVVGRYGGEVPRDPSTFRSLPGVGRYTAGAVMSIAFEREEPIVDGNVRRVFARLLDLADPPEPVLWALASELVVGDRPGDLNQSMMELGALVCTPRTPSCGACPVRDHCTAAAAGTTAERPARRATPPTPVEEYVTIVVSLPDGRRLVRRRPDQGRMAGMWEFPAFPLPSGAEPMLLARQAIDPVVDALAEGVERLGRVEHQLSHVRMAFEVVVARATAPASTGSADRDVRWVTPAELSSLALSRAQRRIATLVAGAESGELVPLSGDGP